MTGVLSITPAEDTCVDALTVEVSAVVEVPGVIVVSAAVDASAGGDVPNSTVVSRLGGVFVSTAPDGTEKSAGVSFLLVKVLRVVEVSYCFVDGCIPNVEAEGVVTTCGGVPWSAVVPRVGWRPGHCSDDRGRSRGAAGLVAGITRLSSPLVISYRSEKSCVNCVVDWSRPPPEVPRDGILMEGRVPEFGTCG